MNDAPDDKQAGKATPSLLGLTPETLRALFEAWSEPSFRVKQVFDWVYAKRADSYGQMTNLPAGLRERLAENLPFYQATVATKQESSDGTVKLLLRWPDGATSECVLIPDGPRQTACISSQVGCPVGCVFCASGLGGLERQLASAQMVEQALRVQRLVSAEGRLTNVVFMGLGEPLANYDATINAVRTINADWGLGIGARKITVSTVGLPSQMRRLAEEGLQITMALSLHAPDDELREQIIPWASRVSIDELVDACAYYFQRTGREVTLEYILLGELNDSVAHARALARVSKRMRSNINLIPYNNVSSLPYLRPEDSAVERFAKCLIGAGVNTHVRRSRGSDIDAACGQLRNRDRVSQGGSVQLGAP